MKIIPLKNAVLFQFLDETRGSDGKFIERTVGSIYIGTVRDNQSSRARWARAIHVGPEVYQVKEGDFILIEAGKWTVGTEIDGEKLWKTDEDCIIGTTNDESLTFSY